MHMFVKDLPTAKPARIHFVGVGGIGMSGLAQLFVSLGYLVSGSDRGADLKENNRIFSALRSQGIDIYPQDGSFCQHVIPDAIVYSTAIEDDNPDLVAADNHHISRLHRAEALAGAIRLKNKQSIAVTGSCGKTTVSSWLGEALAGLMYKPSILSGGLINRFCSDSVAGNYVDGDGDYFVFEADESDKSLVAYQPEYAIILNIGTDHYSKDELIQVFKKFLENVTCGVVVDIDVYKMLGKAAFKHLEVRTFCSRPDAAADFYLTEYRIDDTLPMLTFNDQYTIQLPFPGAYNAANALAIIAMLDLIGMPISMPVLKTLNEFEGVWRRFDYAGCRDSGIRIYDDYAHNVEKIISSIRTAKEICSGQLLILFQPHGYGPLGFMRQPLFDALEEELQEHDCFALLPVFYAGGTTSFKPTSEEVIQSYADDGRGHYRYFHDRDEATLYIGELKHGDMVLIMGARDNSLSLWAQKLAGI